MIRLTFAVWWALVAFWLWNHNVGAQSRSADTPQLKRTFTGSEEVIAFGTSIETAQENALKQVQKRLIDWVPLKAWRPSEGYIRETLLDGPGREKTTNELNSEELSLKKDLEKLGQTVYAWVLTLRPVSLDALKRLDEQYQERADRVERVEQRLLLLGKVHLGLVLALGLMASYCLLDERTRGGYTAWLRLAALSLLVAGAAGWWLLS
jgi:hypothetical protein